MPYSGNTTTMIVYNTRPQERVVYEADARSSENSRRRGFPVMYL